jgi:hypothetical protein
LTLADEYASDCGGHAAQVRIEGREEEPASRARLLSPNSHDAERLGASARRNHLTFQSLEAEWALIFLKNRFGSPYAKNVLQA